MLYFMLTIVLHVKLVSTGIGSCVFTDFFEVSIASYNLIFVLALNCILSLFNFSTQLNNLVFLSLQLTLHLVDFPNNFKLKSLFFTPFFYHS